MSTHNNSRHSTTNLLEIRQLLEFDSTLNDFPDAEKRQQRIVYLNNVMQHIGNGKSFIESFRSFFEGMGLWLMPFAISFMFLPLFFGAWFNKRKVKNSCKTPAIRSFELLAYWQARACPILTAGFKSHGYASAMIPSVLRSAMRKLSKWTFVGTLIAFVAMEIIMPI